MSDTKNFDEHFRRSFDDYSPDVSPDIWENIVSRKKKRRPVAFWLNKKNLLAFAAILVIISGAGLLFDQKNNSKNIALETTVSGRQQGTDKTVPSAVDENKDGTKAGSVSATSTVSNAEGGPAEYANTNNGNTNIADESINAGNVKKMENGKYGEKQKSDNDIDNAEFAEALPSGKNKNAISKKVKIKNSYKIALTGAPAFAVTNQDADNDPAQEEWMIPWLAGSREKISPVMITNWNSHSTVIKPINIPCPEAEKDAAGNKSYFEVYLGPDYAFKKYSDTGNSALIQKRKEAMHFRSAFSAGLRYTRVFGNGMSIRLGVNYSQINEKFSYIKDNVVQIVYVINPAGDTTETYYVRGTRYKNSVNHYRTIDVPVVVGYELGNGRLHANINAGVMVNVYSWQKGETLDNNYAPVSFTTGKQSNAAYQYKTNVGVGFSSAVSVYYKLNDRMHLLAEPYCRFNLSPMNKEAASLQERFTSIGLRLGLRMDLQ